ncbi:hypothetical protein J41TS4_22340 [Paenibacillus apis]|uniref:Phage protein n=1 Tax=Paenibacillus apis TaxID=1792174 RepID=A0A920CJ83_9BACL|nr:hypothetical protein [Paenibacillus apis]GIO42476.1 hypothetical protein J41TS4_22340 [Paenibacillus apis]
MVEVTVNSIRSGVILALSNLFPNMDVYGEEIKQGFEAPCFFVKLLTMGQDQELNRRYRRSHAFDIHFFPKSVDSNEEAHGTAEQLYDKLRLVNIDGAMYRGAGMNHEVVDGVLHFFVDFNFHVFAEKPPGIKMQTLNQEGRLKNGYKG